MRVAKGLATMEQDYDFREIESRWQQRWHDDDIYRVEEQPGKPKYYVLDMFPYPSGAGLHVGHPLGYIATDIVSRYKRMQGYNVLHPMGYDAFGLPAEQYALMTGQHPAITTRNNIARYRAQQARLGMDYDWNRMVCTSEPSYYHWTQWAFLQMFEAYYDTQLRKARPIAALEAYFDQYGAANAPAYGSASFHFTANDWKKMDPPARDAVLECYRLAYRAEKLVNWCPELGTVLANDEVKEGLSVRGGYPVEQRQMTQWCLRVSAYAERLLEGLDRLEWSDSLKEIQRNWIGRSQGAMVEFQCPQGSGEPLWVFTTRPDTLYGVTFLVLAPEHARVKDLTAPAQQPAIERYLDAVAHRSERDRLKEVDQVRGEFTGSYAIHPLTGAKIPIWVGEYVLMGYGSGAIMAVAAHDSRDFAFARHFHLPIVQVVQGPEAPEGPVDTWENAYEAKDGLAVNSPLWDGLPTNEAIDKACQVLEKKGIGYAKVSYRIRDAIFSRQRYWGEPIPIYYKDGVPQPLPANQLPLELPPVDDYRPTPDGQPPLARVKNWTTPEGYPLETMTMPGFAGSSAYFFRYMSPHYDQGLLEKEAGNYWHDVDLYVGGTEHATGHLIYSRFWTKFLFDLGYVPVEEPFKKLVNQGMIQGRSSFVYRVKGTRRYVPVTQLDRYDTTPIHVDIRYVHNDILDVEALRAALPEYKDAQFELENGQYRCGWAVEKMSKSMFNVVNPDTIVEQYGADTLRLYEMFLGPLEMSKPWDTQSIGGVHKFLRKVWRLCLAAPLDDAPASQEALAAINQAIDGVSADIERLSFNTCVSKMMICANELQRVGCTNKTVLGQLVRILCPFAPHMAEELWMRMGHSYSVVNAPWPKADPHYLHPQEVEYPISFNGKRRFSLQFPAQASVEAIALAVREHQQVKDYLAGKPIKKVIVVKGRIVNIVC